MSIQIPAHMATSGIVMVRSRSVGGKGLGGEGGGGGVGKGVKKVVLFCVYLWRL